MMPFIFCAPWLMPMANTRKGTRIEYGSSAKPSIGSRPSCQATATSDAVTTSAVAAEPGAPHVAGLRLERAGLPTDEIAGFTDGPVPVYYGTPNATTFAGLFQ